MAVNAACPGRIGLAPVLALQTAAPGDRRSVFLTFRMRPVASLGWPSSHLDYDEDSCKKNEHSFCFRSCEQIDLQRGIPLR